MLLFFGDSAAKVFVVEISSPITSQNINKLKWLFGDSPQIKNPTITGNFVGPRANMISPWSTNAVEITQNMGIKEILRIEEYLNKNIVKVIDPMLVIEIDGLNQNLFTINIKPKKVLQVQNIDAYNQKEGLALNSDEIKYLKNLAKSLKRPLTDSEVFGFSQVNSEHCRHKIFNGEFIIDGKIQESSLFNLIKKTSKENPNTIVSAYKDNVAFIEGPRIEQFAPESPERPSRYVKKNIDSVISIKAETHNFPTTVEPFNGAATGSGGEIRDRLAGGKGSLPLAGTAVYMTPYSRIQDDWKDIPFKERKWLYQTPIEILIKASNGASDFGNKFGQPLISGSLLTFEHEENGKRLGFDKVIMLAGGIGYGKKDQAQKGLPKKGDKIIILGGDNYRIGMGGAAVSSADTGAFASAIELNAVQRSNPEMQKRVANAIRALVESNYNPIISIHDHGAGGHLNCLSELVEDSGGIIEIDELPLGDPTLSAKEIIGNESQERMGLILSPKDSEHLENIARRERAPFFVVGEVTDDHTFSFHSKKTNETPIDLNLSAFFGSSPKTVMEDTSISHLYGELSYTKKEIEKYIVKVLQIEAVASKDWLTNKVDRCVTGRVAQQQCVGELQLPLSNCGVIALDYKGEKGIATSIGHAPVSGLISAKKGSNTAIAEALTNIVFAPLEKGLESVSLSANWMWPCNNPGEDARLYEAVQECSDFAISLGINIPTGKDSLSMKQKYSDGDVLAPGTVIISAAGQCKDISNVISPLASVDGGEIYYIDFAQDKFHLGGSSFAQSQNCIGNETPSVQDASYFKKAFNAVQDHISSGKVSAGHDIGSGGLITTLLELCFPSISVGMNINFDGLQETDLVKILFSEKVGVVLQSKENLTYSFDKYDVKAIKIGKTIKQNILSVGKLQLSISYLRNTWMATSTKLELHQTKTSLAAERAKNVINQPLKFNFPNKFNGKIPFQKQSTLKAAVIREKGSNSEREMAYMMDLSGFEVRDVHMTDLIEGRENLEDINLLVAVGGFSNSDVLGSAKGWAGAFKYNPKAKSAIENFFSRTDTLSLGVCNGCQLFVELGLITPNHNRKPKMLHNDSGKFECIFTAVAIEKSKAIMLNGLEGSILGIWAAHAEGKFSFPQDESNYQIPAKYLYQNYPSNPNGSDFNAAMLSSEDGRHLVMMPHLERSIFPWNWGHYPKNHSHEISPWIMVFENAYNWIINKA